MSLRSHDVPARILLLLGVSAAAACGEREPAASPASPAFEVPPQPPPPPPPRTGEPPPAPASTSAPSATVEPLPSEPGQPVDKGGCRTNADCGNGLYCQREFTGAGFTDAPGTCVKDPPIYEGRPLVVDGRPRVAAGARASGDAPFSRRASELRAAAFEEHASVAAFARTLCELMALGAPSWLLAKTQSALADEIRHATDTFAWVGRLGAPTEAGPLPEAVAPLRAGPTLGAELLRDVFRGGCVGETLAACRAAERAADESTRRDPWSAELSAFFARIAEDEARHAALAFETARWLLGRAPDLRPVLDEEVERFRRGATDLERGLLEPLLSVLG